MSVLFALLAALCNAWTSVLQRMANLTAPTAKMSGWRLGLFLIRQPLWWFGVLSGIGSLICTAIALYFGQLSVVQPLLVVELIFTMLLRRVWLREAIPAKSTAAAVVICAGLALFLLAARPHEGHRVVTQSLWLYTLGSRAAVVALLLALGQRGSPARRAALYGSAAAIVWSVDSGLMKEATRVLAHHGWIGLFAHWPVYSLAVSTGLGTILLQAALHVGPLSASQPALVIVDPLASIVFGIELFGDRLTRSPGAITAEVIGLLVMAIGVLLITRWAPPVMTARESTQVSMEPDEGAMGVVPPG